MNKNLWKKYKYKGRNHRWEQTKKVPVTIGIVGAGRGVGATHVAIMLAKYLHMDCGGRVAVLECNSHSEFQWINNRLECGVSAFTHQGINFYARVAEEQILTTGKEGMHFRILDYGDEFASHKQSLAKCDFRILVGSNVPWKRCYFDRLVQLLKNETEWFFLYNLIERPEDKKIAKNTYAVGYDALNGAPRKTTCLIFNKILERGVTCARKNTG